MDLAAATHKLEASGQTHLLDHWETLTADEQKRLLQQIEDLDLDMYEIQKHFLVRPPHGTERPDIQPLDHFGVFGDPEDRRIGLEKLKQGRVGCIVVAGGQGTRLGINGPKGICSVTLVRKKTLFQLLAERTLAASRQAGQMLPLAIMTSPLNDAATRDYFKKEKDFGLEPGQLSFFCQGMLPFVGDQGQLLLQHKGRIAMGPDGNGGALHHFVHSGIWETWQKAGITSLCFLQIDNALALPFDPTLIGYHTRKGAQATVKATWRQHADEPVGVLVVEKGHVRVVEYTELRRQEKHAVLEDGTLKHRCANLSIFCFSMDFVAKVAANPIDSFPVHYAHKPVQVMEDGEAHPVKAWKSERFIFDTLCYTDAVEVIVYPRELCYAALKNASGPDSLHEVQKALQAMDRRIYEEISGTTVPADRHFELSPHFYYPTPELLQRWKGIPLPTSDYIE